MKCVRQKAGLQAYTFILVLVLVVSSLSGSLFFQKNAQAFADRSEVVLINNFDETDVTYTNTEGWFSYAMTFSAKRDTNSELCADHASIEEGVGTDGTRAARFWQIRGASSAHDMCISYVRLYDKAENNYRLFTPEADTKYTISLKIKAVSALKDIKVQLRSAASDGTITWNDTVIASLTSAAITASSDADWETLSVSFETGDTVAPLYVSLDTHDGWYSEASEVYVDDITITKTVYAPGEQIINNFDETNVTYTNTEDWFSNAVTFYAKRDNNSELCVNHASIEEGAGADGTKAARFWQIRGSSENDKAVSYIRLYDTTENGYLLFTPKENTYYTVSLKVKVVTCSKHINIQLRSAAEDGTIAYNDTVVASLTSSAIEVSEDTDWQEFTVTFLNKDTTAPLYIALTTHDTWWSEVSEVYMDDIEIIKRREIPVSISNYDGEDQIVPVLPDITFSEFEPSSRSGYEFAGCYTDEARTQKANDDDLVTESEHIWVKWKLKKAFGTEPVLTKHLSGDLNDDKNVDMTDLIRLRKMSAGAVDITYGADLNGDGDYASYEDLNTMKQYILGAPGTKYGRKLVWADEFNYSELDTSTWKYKQTMTTSDTEYSEENNRANTRFEYGNMTLQVNRIDDNTYSVAQGLVTQGNLLFQYGYLEMRAKIPTCGGSWPGFWLMANTPYLDFSTYGYWPEIDIFEAFGNNKVKAELHKHFTESSLSLDGYESTYGSISTGSYRYSISEGYHTFGFMWDDTTMKFYVDDQLYRTINYTRFTQDGTGAGAYQAPFYLMMNNEILNGQSWAGSWVTSSTETPIEYSIDYIRLYQDTTEGSIERLYTGEMAEKKVQ